MRYLVYLDSRNSLGPRPSLCQFNLNQQIVNARELRVVSFVFTNTFYNVTENNNQIVFDSFTLVIPPAHYTTSQLLNYITTSCQANPAFTSVVPPPQNPCVTLDPDGQTLIWQIGGQSLQYNTLFTTDPNRLLHGTFFTGIFLGSPWAIALNSPALQGATRFVSSVPNRIVQPFYVQHVQSAHNQIESSDTSVTMQWATPLSHANLQTLEVMLIDPYLNRELAETGAWCALLEVLV